MSLRDTLQEDMKNAMRAHDSLKLGTIRFLLAQIKNIEIDNGPQSEDQLAGIIRKQIKQMKEAISDYEKGGRADLVEEEGKKVAVLEQYLPKMMDHAEVEALVIKVIAENPGSQMGQVIGLVRQASEGRADGGEIAQLVKAKLA